MKQRLQKTKGAFFMPRSPSSVQEFPGMFQNKTQLRQMMKVLGISPQNEMSQYFRPGDLHKTSDTEKDKLWSDYYFLEKTIFSLLCKMWCSCILRQFKIQPIKFLTSAKITFSILIAICNFYRLCKELYNVSHSHIYSVLYVMDFTLHISTHTVHQ